MVTTLTSHLSSGTLKTDAAENLTAPKGTTDSSECRKSTKQLSGSGGAADVEEVYAKYNMTEHVSEREGGVVWSIV